MSAVLLSPTDGEWDEVLRSSPHSGYHLPAYVETDAARRGGAAWAFRYREDDRALLFPLVLRPVPDGEGRTDATTPTGFSGPVASTQDAGFWLRAIEAMAGTLADAGVVCCFARLHPLLPAPRDALAGFGELVEHGESVSVDLSRPTARIEAEMRDNHRRQIRRARRDGDRVTVDDWQHLGAFVSAYAQTMARVGATEDYLFGSDYFGELVARLGDRLHLLVVTAADGTPRGGALLLETGRLVEYHLGATADGHLAHNPNKLVLDEAWRWAQGRGHCALHLGLGTGRADDPLLHFKAGFSPKRDVFATYRMVTDQQAYDALTASRGSSSGGFFPAYRSPA